MKNMQPSGKMINYSPWYGCTKTLTLNNCPKTASDSFIWSQTQFQAENTLEKN